MSSATAELRVFLSTPPPNNANPPLRDATSIAYAALENLRQTGDPSFLFLRTLMEQTTCSDPSSQDSSREEILFHCITGFRHVMLNKWDSWDTAFKHTCRDYVFYLAFWDGVNLPKTVVMGCLKAAASFWKRDWFVEDATTTTTCDVLSSGGLTMTIMNELNQRNIPRIATKVDLFSRLEAIISLTSSSSAVNPRSAYGAAFLSILLGEFSSGSGYNQSLEFHTKSKEYFQKFGLTECLRLSISSLSNIIQLFPQSAPPQSILEISLSVTSLLENVLSWDFGSFAAATRQTLIRPPSNWRPHLLSVPFLQSLFHFYQIILTHSNTLSHSIRQVFILYSSLAGSIFSSLDEKANFCSFWCQAVLSIPIKSKEEMVDVCTIILRLICNFKLSILEKCPVLSSILELMQNIGREVLNQGLTQCIEMKGDMDAMEDDEEWRRNTLELILEGGVILIEEAFFSRSPSLNILSGTLSSLYGVYITTRIQMANWEEVYLATEECDMDEVKEEISTNQLADEMTAASSLGRLDLSNSLSSLAGLLQGHLDQLPTLTGMSPQAAGILEETRLLIVCAAHLLTDGAEGETNAIPQSVPKMEQTAIEIAVLVSPLTALGELLANHLAQNPTNEILSPLLGKTILWFFDRFIPAYIGEDGIYPPQEGEKIVSFAITVCIHFYCYWPREKQVLDMASKLLNSISKQSKMRKMIFGCPAWSQLVNLHCLTAHLSHDTVVTSCGNGTQEDWLKGYRRINYDDRGRVLTALLMGCSDEEGEKMWNGCLESVQTAFLNLVQELSNKQISPQEVSTEERVLLSISLYNGVAQCSEISKPERIPQYLTPALPHLSNLMVNFAQNLSICEKLLELFRNYAEIFIVMLNNEQSIALFRSCAELLKSYSAKHCQARVIVRPVSSSLEANLEEEQSYSDILCAIQLLIHLGNKDFIDTESENQIDSEQVTDVIFYGIQQIVPLMTQGLLQYPKLGNYYFSLVGFMMDTYPEKACTLPVDLFQSLLDSLLFGISHLDPSISKNSLRGLAEVVREHLKTGALNKYLPSKPDLLENCLRRLLSEVIFQKIVWDRLEGASMALLPLMAVDVNRFVGMVWEVVTGVSGRMVAGWERKRLEAAITTLAQVENLPRIAVGGGGFQGRKMRLHFRSKFEVFVKDVHSFFTFQ